MSSPDERQLPTYTAFGGVMYTFKKAGDALPWHNHSEIGSHVMIVARGLLRFDSGRLGAGGERIVDRSDQLGEGAFVDIPTGVFHEVTALVDNTRIFNILKGE